jgi:hypothetical protein
MCDFLADPDAVEEIHAYPDFVHRAQDMIDVAIDAAKAGMRAVAAS